MGGHINKIAIGGLEGLKNDPEARTEKVADKINVKFVCLSRKANPCLH
jgi:hypothetical protein